MARMTSGRRSRKSSRSKVNRSLNRSEASEEFTECSCRFAARTLSGSPYLLFSMPVVDVAGFAWIAVVEAVVAGMVAGFEGGVHQVDAVAE
ncbi:hypothetical protein V22_32090 [Calycomorphotria hydatis]|uniref:Uncharacterized protein n=1 Tax=Calycomorphotria hydatis TaxID=2528027 RepID=A0A517TC40_9PLAN|nr:hypothetical protein V22_32090 [Calycomorphotria hydatis]